MSFHDLGFYECTQERIKFLADRDKIKAKVSTQDTEEVTKVLNHYKEKGMNEQVKIFKVLESIRTKTYDTLLKGNPLPTHKEILEIVGNESIMAVAYRTVRKNEGAMTPAYFLPNNIFKNLPPTQQEIIFDSYWLPDGFSRPLLEWVCESVRKGTYVWGASRRIWIPKPGTDKLRPITIPPFMDKMVQEAIRMVLEAIFEPEFMKMNCSFGFRAGFGCHHNIVSLTDSRNTQTFKIAIEGDIKDAYPSMDRNILLTILEERIKDRKFLNFMRKRLSLIVYDVKAKEYEKTEVGLPQGGVDSPYLFNIYLLGLDKFIKNDLQKKLIDPVNEFRGVDKRVGEYKYNPRSSNYNERRKHPEFVSRYMKLTQTTLKEKLNKAKTLGISVEEYDFRLPKANIAYKNLKQWKRYKEVYELRKSNLSKITRIDDLYKELFYQVRLRNLLRHKLRQVRSTDPNRTKIQYHYSRYADDFIVVGNFNKVLAKRFKQEITDWLLKERKQVLSPEKTVITDLYKDSAHFLGFELFARKTRKLTKVTDKKTGKSFLRRTAGWFLSVIPDRQRLVNRLHMKGYCNAKGNPIHIPWISGMEPHIIIERFMSVSLGLANYYANFITSKQVLNRWLYVVRWSCLKTLALKYNTNIAGVMNRFQNADGTISAKYLIRARDKTGKLITYSKEWSLLSEGTIIRRCSDYSTRMAINQLLLDIDSNKQVSNTNSSGRTPRIFDVDFLEKINWVNFRTQANFGLPCSICGASQNMEMHHIRHIRKRKYSSIPANETWTKVMALRNRKQIPLCSNCHDRLHAGKYRGESIRLINLSPRLFDNRIVNSENYITPAIEPIYSLPLTEHLASTGWRDVNNKTGLS